jgi:hypothetical protein
VGFRTTMWSNFSGVVFPYISKSRRNEAPGLSSCCYSIIVRAWCEQAFDIREPIHHFITTYYYQVFENRPSVGISGISHAQASPRPLYEVTGKRVKGWGVSLLLLLQLLQPPWPWSARQKSYHLGSLSRPSQSYEKTSKLVGTIYSAPVGVHNCIIEERQPPPLVPLIIQLDKL